MASVIVGCGDIGRRIAKQLLGAGSAPVEAYVNSPSSVEACAELSVDAKLFDLDDLTVNLANCHAAQVYYSVAPQSEGRQDLRSRALLASFDENRIRPNKVVLISTTGVYGDSQGQWVDETSPTEPQSERGQRRLDAERRWSAWCSENTTPLVILRVPGIYAKARIPIARLKKRTPVVRQAECGYSNRIHAEDLARAAVLAMQSAITQATSPNIYNVSDGRPGSITEYLQAAAEVAGLPALPEISMYEAQHRLSPGMLSYLQESRRISNKKLLTELGFELRFRDFHEGLNF